MPYIVENPLSHVDTVVSRYRHPLLFFFLATAIPWALWFVAGAISRSPEPNWTLIAVLAIAGLFAPALVAAVLIWRDPVLRRDVLHRLVNVREVPAWAWLLAVVLLPGALLLGTALSIPLGYSPDQFGLREGFSFTSGLVPGWVTLGLAAIVEELAWKSYGTDAMASKWTVLRASLVFGVVWFFWHVPLATIEGMYQAEVVETGLLASINFGVSVFPFVIIMNWLYYRSGRNILLPMVFHLVANFGNELWQTHPDTKAIQTAILLVVSVIVVWKERELFFTRPTKAAA